MKKLSNNSVLKSKSSFWILIVAAVVMEGTACLQYFTNRVAIKREAIQRAESELRKAELEIEKHTVEMEAAAKTLAMIAEKHVNCPDSIYSDTRAVVGTIDNTTSIAVAYVPGYFPKKGTFFEVCSSRISKDSIYTRQIGSAEHDYTQMEWYRNGFVHDSCWWCEPYLDDSGSKTYVVSCSYPVHDKKGEVVAVVCVDLALDYLERISGYLQIFPESYYSIRSSTGVDIIGAPDTIPGRKYMVFDEESPATGWQMSIIIPEDILYADLRRLGLYSSLLMLVGLALLIYILYRSRKNMQELMVVNSQKERMLGDLETARNIQMAMLPKTFPPYPHRLDLSMFGMVEPAKEVGGDLYDFYERDDKLFFCVGDVSGKGVPASLVMATTRSLFRSFSAHEHDVAALAAQINDAMSETNELNMFVTLFLGIMDLKTGELKYCNAGHNAPVLIGHALAGGLQKIEMLPTIPNLPVGILSGYAYTPQTVTVQRGDSLFLYTDGLTEAENINHEQFGEQRMLDTLRSFESAQVNAVNLNVAKQQIETMLAAVQSFVGDAEQSDDLTMLAIRYLPLAEQPVEEAKPIKYSIVMRNDIQQIPTLAEWVEGLHIPAALNMTINLALEEAVTNVMLYAYPDGKGTVLIEAEKDDDEIRFVISDSGIPFDPTETPEADITLSAEERAIGGLGIHLVRQIMDHIAYNRKNKKNILTLVKKL